MGALPRVWRRPHSALPERAIEHPNQPHHDLERGVRMSVSSRRGRAFAAVALAVGLALAAACSNEPDEPSDTGPVTVTIQWFGAPGFDKAITDFQAKFPNIKVD